MIIQKALRKKNYTAKESAGKSKSQTELSELADMCNYQAKNSNEQEAINELNLNQESAYCKF